MKKKMEYNECSKPKGRITAAEARLLSGLTLDEKIDNILTVIFEAATNKKRELRTGYDYTPDADLWINGGYSRTDDWEYARKALTDLGYDVSFYYSDESLAVDMYTLIKW